MTTVEINQASVEVILEETYKALKNMLLYPDQNGAEREIILSIFTKIDHFYAVKACPKREVLLQTEEVADALEQKIDLSGDGASDLYLRMTSNVAE